jgi:hypothetical protein
MSRSFYPNEDNELGEHRGCDRREYLLDDGVVVGVCWFRIDCPISDLQRPEDFEPR